MAMMDPTTHRDTGFRLTGWHVLAILLAMFAVMIAVNALFVTMALKTFSGEADHAYMNGLKFNETIHARAEQAQTGWRMSLDLARDAQGGAVVMARLVDRNGDPVRGATMSGLIGRPATQAQDQTLRFAETAPGVYSSARVPLGPGRWRFSAKAELQGYPEFMTETSLSLR